MSNYQHERGWLDSEVWGDAPYSEREAWSWMIGEASFDKRVKNISGMPVKIERGQFSASIRFMSKKFKWSTGKVQRYLKKLQRWKMIEKQTETDTAQNIITICNYCKYQNKKGKSDTHTDTPPDTGAIHPRTQTRIPSNPSSPSNINREKAIRSLQEFENHPLDEHYKAWFEKNCPMIDRFEKRDAMVRWCRAKGKSYKDYWSALQDWAKRDEKKQKQTSQSNFTGELPNQEYL